MRAKEWGQAEELLGAALKAAEGERARGQPVACTHVLPRQTPNQPLQGPLLRGSSPWRL